MAGSLERGAAGPTSRRLLTRLARRLRWLIATRLLVATSVLLPYILLQWVSLSEVGAPQVQFDFVYFLAGATYAASLLYLLLLQVLAHRVVFQAHLQFLGDLLLITALVYYFGGISSPFSILYLVVVIVASSLLARRAGMMVATVAWLLYAVVVVSVQLGWVQPPHVPSDPISAGRVVYYLATHLFGFYAVAMMTSRLAQTATLTERELIARREDLAALRVAHRDVVESIPSGLMTTDLDGTVATINRAGLNILGRSEEELLGQPVWSVGLFSPQEWLELANASPASRGRLEVEVATPDGPRLIGYSVSRLTRADGPMAGRIVIFQDLSEWRSLQEELRLRDRMAAVGELASGIAHEIGNPLAAISGSVQMLSSTLEPRSSHAKLLQIILRESQRLDRTIKSFLKFARPGERSSVRFDVAQLLSEHVELLRNSPEVTADHELLLDLTPPSVSIVADPDQVSQIFWNLARNALRAMPDGGRLRIFGSLQDDVFHMRFVDTGRGMTEKERARLFHPFQSAFGGGTGIGMAIVYQIVQEHGGRLRVESRPGEGTDITVELPQAMGTGALETRAAGG